jgi:hypothetical protein
MVKMITGIVSEPLFWDDLVDMFKELEVEKEMSQAALERGFHNDMEMFVFDAMEKIGVEPSQEAVAYVINSVGLVREDYSEAEYHIHKVPEGFYVAVATA